MPRYEFVEGSSSKFWVIELEGSSFTTTYGKIGTDGQTSVKDWDSEEKAKKEYDKLIAEKVKKGYQLVGGADAAAPAAKAAAPAAKAAQAPKKEPAAKKADLFEDEGEDEDEAPKKKPAAKPAPAKAAPAAKPEPAKAAPAAAPGAAGGKRHFEFVEGSSSKFWEIELEGTSVITTYGRIGTDGQNTVKEFDTEAKAAKEYDKLVAEKTKKGYVEK